MLAHHARTAFRAARVGKQVLGRRIKATRFLTVAAPCGLMTSGVIVVIMRIPASEIPARDFMGGARSVNSLEC